MSGPQSMTHYHRVVELALIYAHLCDAGEAPETHRVRDELADAVEAWAKALAEDRRRAALLALQGVEPSAA